jgi:hypothetical protein
VVCGVRGVRYEFSVARYRFAVCCNSLSFCRKTYLFTCCKVKFYIGDC